LTGTAQLLSGSRIRDRSSEVRSQKSEVGGRQAIRAFPRARDWPLRFRKTASDLEVVGLVFGRSQAKVKQSFPEGVAGDTEPPGGLCLIAPRLIDGQPE
jgi:hypothetical protein